MGYQPTQYYKLLNKPPDPPEPPNPDAGNKVKVYWKKNDGSLGQIDADNMHHEDAIIKVQETLLGEGESYNEPMLALLQGGKA